MKNGHKVLSVVSGILQLFSLLAFFIVVLFQKFFKGFMGGSPEAMEVFSFPIAQTIYMLLITASVLLIVLGAFTKGRGAWAHILGIVVIAVLCPLLLRFGSILENQLVSNRGVEYLISNSVLQGVTGIVLLGANVASSLALVAAGMGMVAKKLLPANKAE